MPDTTSVTKKKYAVAKELNRRFGERMWKLGETPGASFDNPAYKQLSSALRDTDNIVNRYESENREVDDEGKLTAPPPTRLPSEIVADKTKSGPGGFDYHFEPSVAEARKAYRADPALAVKLGLDPEWLHGVAQPEQSVPMIDPTGVGSQVGAYVIPAKTHLEMMSEGDDPYKAYAEHLWKQRIEEAKGRGIARQRYKDIPFRKGQIGDYLLGGLMYNIERRIDPMRVGVSNAMTMGTAGPIADAVNERFGDAERPSPTSQEIANRNPLMNTIGEVAGYAMPGNPTNLIQSALTKAGGYGAANGLIKGLGTSIPGKAGVSAGTGAVVNTLEGGVRDVAQGLSEGQAPGEIAGTAFENAPLNFGTGLGFSLGGELIGQGADAARRSMRRSPRFNDLSLLEEAGGGSDFIGGVHQGPEMEPYFARQDESKTKAKAGPIAAQEIVPQMREHLAQRGKAQSEEIHGQMQEYFRHPYYGRLTVDSKPMIDELVKMAQEGRYEGHRSGQSKFPNPKKVRTIGEQIEDIADEIKWVPAEQADAFAKENNGTIIDRGLADRILDTKGAHDGDVAVAISSPIGAESITEYERMIDDALGFSRTSTSKDDPVFKGLNAAIKGMRDKLPYYIDDAGKLMSPPGYKRPGSMMPPTERFPSQQPGPSTPSVDVEVAAPSASSEALTPSVRAEDETALDTTDFIPSTKELDSGDLTAVTENVRPEDVADLIPSGQELGSADFIQEPPVARRTRQRKPPAGPQRADHETFQDYMEARAEWRLADGRATTNDLKRLQKKAERLGTPPKTMRATDAEPSPVTPKIPSEAPTTQRSITPEDATPLSLLAGNKLAMDVPGEQLTGGSRSYPDESVPAPMAKDWQEANQETGNWYEEIVAPGRDPRSSEAKRMGDLTSQKQAFDDAKTQIQDVEQRLGEMGEDDRTKSLLGIISEKLGRQVTLEDLVRAGLMGGGLVGAMSGDSGAEDAGLGAMMLGGLGGGRKRGKSRAAPSEGPTSIIDDIKGARQLEGKLDNGTTVTGFSALRQKQHEALDELARVERATGVHGDDATIDRLISFGQGNKVNNDEALLAVAKELGLEKELYRVAALAVYPKLRDRAFLGLHQGGLFNWGPVDPALHRADRALQLMSGAQNPLSGAGNPFNRGVIRDASERFFNLTGGRLGARHGDQLQQLLEYINPEGEERPNATP